MTAPFTKKDAESALLLKKIGDDIGYGFMMHVASALWRKSLKDQGYPVTGAFIPDIKPNLDDTEKRTMEFYDQLIDEALSKNF